MMDNDYYWYWINNIQRIGNVKRKRLLAGLGSPENVFNADIRIIAGVDGISEMDAKIITDAKNNQKICENFIKLKNSNIMYTHPGAGNYPVRLRELYDYPDFLYFRGRLPENDVLSVAVVGSRSCSEYGREVAYKLGYELAARGVSVISGMADGVDSYAHKGALDAGGYTAAVMGCGADVCYPRHNIEMYMNIVRYGGIISEYPPGSAPLQGRFPERNRIISGLADIIIVVEARKKSGSLITADQALEQNKDVMVVPGRITDRLSEGCNELIKQGAPVLTGIADVFEYFDYKGIKYQKNLIKEDKEIKKYGDEKTNLLASRKDIVYSCFDLCSKTIDILIEETGMDISELSEILLELQLEGWIEECSKNCYIKSITN